MTKAPFVVGQLIAHSSGAVGAVSEPHPSRAIEKNLTYSQTSRILFTSAFPFEGNGNALPI